MKISTLVAIAFLSGLIPAAWGCDYGKPTDASAAPEQMAAVAAPAASRVAAPVATVKAPTASTAQLVKPSTTPASQKKQVKQVVVACDGGNCD